MKKYFIVSIFLMFIPFYLWTQDIKVVERVSDLKMEARFPEYTLSYVTGISDGAYIVWNWASSKGLKIKNENLYFDKDGFSYCYIDDSTKKTIICGSNFVFTFGDSSWTTIKTEKIPSMATYCKSIKKFNDQIDITSSRESALQLIKLPQFNIENILSSSEYSETTKNGKVSYSADFLNIFIEIYFEDSTFLLRNPWVPGKENSSAGIGEYLEIEFTKPKNNLVVLNGFVDLEKRYLYKANNRVKKAVITSLDKDNPFEIEYEFEDYVHFSEIKFPAAVNKVRFTIKEVYKGNKWDDTCITAVITRWEN